MEMKGQNLPSINRYILPNKIFCSMVGLWPIDENESTTYKVFAYFRLFFALAIVCSIFIPEILAIVMNWGDLQVFTGSGSFLEMVLYGNFSRITYIIERLLLCLLLIVYVLSGVGCVSTTVGQMLFKMIYLLARRRRMIRIYKEVRALWKSSDDSRDRMSLERLAYLAKIFTVGFYLSGMCNITTFTIAAAVGWVKQGRTDSNKNNNTTADRHLPFEVWYGPNSMQSPTYEIAFLCQVLTSFICCSGICGLDATFMTLILHVCGQFTLIQVWIRKLGMKVGGNEIFPEGLTMEMNRCIRHHQRMIEVVKEVNNLLSPIIFVQLLTSGLEICLSGYAVTSGAKGTDLLKFAGYLFSMILQLLIWCWPAEMVIEESQKIGNDAYFEIPWYELPIVYRKNVHMMIARAQCNCRITALTFQTVSISTLTNVFNTAASYFTLLRQVQ